MILTYYVPDYTELWWIPLGNIHMMYSCFHLRDPNSHACNWNMTFLQRFPYNHTAHCCCYILLCSQTPMGCTGILQNRKLSKLISLDITCIHRYMLKIINLITFLSTFKTTPLQTYSCMSLWQHFPNIHLYTAHTEIPLCYWCIWDTLQFPHHSFQLPSHQCFHCNHTSGIRC